MRGRTSVDGEFEECGAGDGWAAVVRGAASLLRRHGRLAVTGPWGAGKSTLLEALAERSPVQEGVTPRRCLWVTAQEGDADVCYGALVQLLSAAEANGCEGGTPPRPQDRASASASAGAGDPELEVDPSGGSSGSRRPPTTAAVQLLRHIEAPSPSHRLTLRLALTRMFSEGPPLLLVIDGAQWLDPDSADLIGYALRTVPPAQLGALVAERTSGRPPVAAALLGGHPAVFPVPPADLTETAATCARIGLPVRWAAAVHRHGGGHRALLDAWVRHGSARAPTPGATAAPAVPSGMTVGLSPAPPRQVRELAAAWLASVPSDVVETLQVAALAGTCDVDLLRHSGRRRAEDHLSHAFDAGLLLADQDRDRGQGQGQAQAHGAPYRFAATALADAAAATVSHDRRTAIHRALAACSHGPVARALHAALAQETPAPVVAEETAYAATLAHAAGERPRAAQLLLLAARLTPADRPRLRLERFAAAAEQAAAAGSAALTRRAADRIMAEHGTRAQRVHALLAVVDATGQDTAGARPLLATARRIAADDPELLAAVELRAAVQANISGEDHAGALHHAEAAAALAVRARNSPLEAAALTMTARMRRVLGRVDAAATVLDRALSLAVPPARLGVRNSPQYLAARHAVFDARPAEARTLLLQLLPVAEESGEPEDLVDLWRSLAEVDAGRGACGDALRWADRAVDLTAAAGLSPGPAWYTAALAQACGGRHDRALHFAAHAVRASREEEDALHTARGLWVLGATLLHTGRVESAAAALAEVAELESRSGAADPTVLRWQGDAVEAFALSGRTREAQGLLETMQERVGPHPAHAALRASLTRARALRHHLDGAGDEAAELLTDAAEVFARLGLPVEEGRTHLLRGRVERRRRRAAAARAAWETARSLFADAEAHPWSVLAEDHLSHLTGRAPGQLLTEHELRLAELVRTGATNQEAAQQMFISVKTVETVLSRVYRKLGIRSRTQLAAALTA
ncbi:LuxR C-terminal-related transcriptional regulator [Streptomyces sp. NPDC005865]|uniref:helix-turn-helix transcriptional regulator n=1 Tax=Streptomyces sp. NPDC005865 TaxID=3155453 RepID=UPI0033E89740